MRRIGEIVPSSSIPTSKATMSEKWIAKLFAKFQARYAHKMSSAYPTQVSLDIALDEWAEELANLSGSDVKRGLEVWQEDWPPSLPEFKKACKKPRQIAAHQDFVFLPKPKPDKKLGAKAFSEMKEKLRC